MESKSIVESLNKYAPLHLSESWDNTGLLVEHVKQKVVSLILLTNDLTLEVLKEAEDLGTDFIISYHPPIFRPLKKITRKNWKERIIGQCIANGIAVYSPHTCYDALKGGVNDWLISAFGEGQVFPLSYSHEQTLYTHCIKLSGQQSGMSADHILQIITSNLVNHEILKEIKLSKESETRIEIFCKEKHIPSIVSKMSEIQAEINHYEIYKLEKAPIPECGMGRLVKLSKPVPLSMAVQMLKKHLKLPHVRLALKHEGTLDDLVSSVAVCAGAGSSVLRGATADLFVTGELSHHEVLDFAQSGTSTILTDHSNSERGFLEHKLKPDLEAILGKKVTLKVSRADRDPLEIV